MMKTAKSDSLERLVRILSDRGPMRAGQIGQELWWKPGDVIRPENNALTMHCRAAGKLLRQAERAGLVRCEDRGRYRMWFANARNQGQTPQGEKHE
jgi:hypothetical protein